MIIFCELSEHISHDLGFNAANSFRFEHKKEIIVEALIKTVFRVMKHDIEEEMLPQASLVMFSKLSKHVSLTGKVQAVFFKMFFERYAAHDRLLQQAFFALAPSIAAGVLKVKQVFNSRMLKEVVKSSLFVDSLAVTHNKVEHGPRLSAELFVSIVSAACEDRAEKDRGLYVERLVELLKQVALDDTDLSQSWVRQILYQLPTLAASDDLQNTVAKPIMLQLQEKLKEGLFSTIQTMELETILPASKIIAMTSLLKDREEVSGSQLMDPTSDILPPQLLKKLRNLSEIIEIPLQGKQKTFSIDSYLHACVDCFIERVAHRKLSRADKKSLQLVLELAAQVKGSRAFIASLTGLLCMGAEGEQTLLNPAGWKLVAAWISSMAARLDAEEGASAGFLRQHSMMCLFSCFSVFCKQELKKKDKAEVLEMLQTLCDELALSPLKKVVASGFQLTKLVKSQLSAIGNSLLASLGEVSTKWASAFYSRLLSYLLQHGKHSEKKKYMLLKALWHSELQLITVVGAQDDRTLRTFIDFLGSKTGQTIGSKLSFEQGWEVLNGLLDREDAVSLMSTSTTVPEAFLLFADTLPVRVVEDVFSHLTLEIIAGNGKGMEATLAFVSCLTEVSVTGGAVSKASARCLQKIGASEIVLNCLELREAQPAASEQNSIVTRLLRLICKMGVSAESHDEEGRWFPQSYSSCDSSAVQTLQQLFTVKELGPLASHVDFSWFAKYEEAFASKTKKSSAHRQKLDPSATGYFVDFLIWCKLQHTCALLRSTEEACSVRDPLYEAVYRCCFKQIAESSLAQEYESHLETGNRRWILILLHWIDYLSTGEAGSSDFKEVLFVPDSILLKASLQSGEQANVLSMLLSAFCQGKPEPSNEVTCFLGNVLQGLRDQPSEIDLGSKATLKLVLALFKVMKHDLSSTSILSADHVSLSSSTSLSAVVRDVCAAKIDVQLFLDLLPSHEIEAETKVYRKYMGEILAVVLAKAGSCEDRKVLENIAQHFQYLLLKEKSQITGARQELLTHRCFEGLFLCIDAFVRDLTAKPQCLLFLLSLEIETILSRHYFDSSYQQQEEAQTKDNSIVLFLQKYFSAMETFKGERSDEKWQQLFTFLERKLETIPEEEIALHKQYSDLNKLGSLLTALAGHIPKDSWRELVTRFVQSVLRCEKSRELLNNLVKQVSKIEQGPQFDLVDTLFAIFHGAVHCQNRGVAFVSDTLASRGVELYLKLVNTIFTAAKSDVDAEMISEQHIVATSLLKSVEASLSSLEMLNKLVKAQSLKGLGDTKRLVSEALMSMLQLKQILAEKEMEDDATTAKLDTELVVDISTKFIYSLEDRFFTKVFITCLNDATFSGDKATGTLVLDLLGLKYRLPSLDNDQTSLKHVQSRRRPAARETAVLLSNLLQKVESIAESCDLSPTAKQGASKASLMNAAVSSISLLLHCVHNSSRVKPGKQMTANEPVASEITDFVPLAFQSMTTLLLETFTNRKSFDAEGASIAIELLNCLTIILKMNDINYTKLIKFVVKLVPVLHVFLGRHRSDSLVVACVMEFLYNSIIHFAEFLSPEVESICETVVTLSYALKQGDDSNEEDQEVLKTTERLLEVIPVAVSSEQMLQSMKRLISSALLAFNEGKDREATAFQLVRYFQLVQLSIEVLSADESHAARKQQKLLFGTVADLLFLSLQADVFQKQIFISDEAVDGSTRKRSRQAGKKRSLKSAESSAAAGSARWVESLQPAREELFLSFALGLSEKRLMKFITFLDTKLNKHRFMLQEQLKERDSGATPGHAEVLSSVNCLNAYYHALLTIVDRLDDLVLNNFHKLLPMLITDIETNLKLNVFATEVGWHMQQSTLQLLVKTLNATMEFATLFPVSKTSKVLSLKVFRRPSLSHLGKVLVSHFTEILPLSSLLPGTSEVSAESKAIRKSRRTAKQRKRDRGEAEEQSLFALQKQVHEISKARYMALTSAEVSEALVSLFKILHTLNNVTAPMEKMLLTNVEDDEESGPEERTGEGPLGDSLDDMWQNVHHSIIAQLEDETNIDEEDSDAESSSDKKQEPTSVPETVSNRDRVFADIARKEAVLEVIAKLFEDMKVLSNSDEQERSPMEVDNVQGDKFASELLPETVAAVAELLESRHDLVRLKANVVAKRLEKVSNHSFASLLK